MTQALPLRTGTWLHTEKEPGRDHTSPDYPSRCRSFGRKLSLRASQSVVFARVPPTTLVLETPHTQSPTADQSRSHLPCCEHSWAEQTTGPSKQCGYAETTHVKHGSSQTNRKDRYACWFACTSLDSLAIPRQIIPERGHSYRSPRNTISVVDKRSLDGSHMHSDNQLAAVAACTPSVPRIVPCLTSTDRQNPIIDKQPDHSPCFASTDRPSPIIDRHFEHAPCLTCTD